MKLKDKVAIVTGAGSGMGRAIALGFAGEGAKVLVTDVNRAGGEETVKMIRDQGREAVFLLTDVSRSEEVQKMVATAVEKYGKIDILVNNAGVDLLGNSQTVAEEDWNRTIAVNLTGPFLCAKYAIAKMKESGGGVIINIASVEGLSGLSNQVAYSSSKGGVINLTKCLAIDHARDNIRVNAICPGGIETPMVMDLVNKEGMEPLKKYLIRQHALRRFGKPEEIAKVAVFLASDDSSFIIGSHIIADGGWLCGKSMSTSEIFKGQ
ncbi:MAG: glucose 1-dehydrogenase [Deltaproteobacteria bacterium]|nr:MAG: glucose 1-dehydrogenase [Deltaproteobacteria bacterium]